jgi:ethanolamine transporter EutH
MFNGEEYSLASAEANDIRELIVSILYLAAMVVSCIVFIRWFRRAYYNLHQLMDNLSFSEGMAAGAWFIPFVNLYRPYQIFKEMFVQTKKVLINHDKLGNNKLSLVLLRTWWFLWVITAIIGNIQFRMSLDSEGLGDLLSLTKLGMFVNVISIPLGFLAVGVVRSYSKVEPLLNEISQEDNSPNIEQHIVQD